jgi:hypothetical protein
MPPTDQLTDAPKGNLTLTGPARETRQPGRGPGWPDSVGVSDRPSPRERALRQQRLARVRPNDTVMEERG